MGTLLAFLVQFVRICLAYVAACLGVGLFATVAVTMNAPEIAGRSVAELVLQLAVFGWLGTAILAGNVAFWPAVAAIVTAELFRLQSLAFFLVAGMVIGLVPAIPVDVLVGTADPTRAPEAFLPFFVACGAVGGFVYWLAAGRHAGGWTLTLRLV